MVRPGELALRSVEMITGNRCHRVSVQFRCEYVRDSAYGTNCFAMHAGDIAWLVYCDGIKAADEARFLGAHGHTGAAINAGVPADRKNNSFFCAHRLYFFILRIRAEIIRHGFVQSCISLSNISRIEYVALDTVQFPHIISHRLQPVVVVSFQVIFCCGFS